jgi:hypothetical protein
VLLEQPDAFELATFDDTVSAPVSYAEPVAAA